MRVENDSTQSCSDPTRRVGLRATVVDREKRGARSAPRTGCRAVARHAISRSTCGTASGPEHARWPSAASVDRGGCPQCGRAERSPAARPRRKCRHRVDPMHSRSRRGPHPIHRQVPDFNPSARRRPRRLSRRTFGSRGEPHLPIAHKTRHRAATPRRLSPYADAAWSRCR